MNHEVPHKNTNSDRKNGMNSTLFVLITNLCITQMKPMSFHSERKDLPCKILEIHTPRQTVEKGILNNDDDEDYWAYHD